MTDDLNAYDSELRKNINAKAARLCDEWLSLRGGSGSKLADATAKIKDAAAELIEWCNFAPPYELKRLVRLLLTIDPVSVLAAEAPRHDGLSDKQIRAADWEAINATEGAEGPQWPKAQVVADALAITTDALKKWRQDEHYQARRKETWWRPRLISSLERGDGPVGK